MSDGDGAIILLYHRITTPQRDPQMLCVSPANLESQLDVLRRRRRVVPLAELAQNLARGHVPPGAAAITFDDGYADNLHEAAPILRRFDMPATVFATTAHAANDGEFFWDDLDRIFLSPGELPARGRVEAEDQAFEIDVESAASYSPAEAARHARWTVLEASDPTPRHRAYRGLCRLLHRSTVARRRDLLGQLQAWSGAPLRSSHRMMSRGQIRQLCADGLIEIGGHTVDHPVLSVEHPEVQRRQIIENQKALESAAGRPLAGFSYPFGTRHDFTTRTTDLVCEAGYAFACANMNGSLTESTDPLRLPRFIVRDWEAEEFERRLCSRFSPRVPR